MRGSLKFSKGQKCHYCARVMIGYKQNMTPHEKALMATDDHKTPKNLGGSNDPENRLVACGRCNQLKDSIPYVIFKVWADMVLREYPNIPTPVLRNSLKLYIMHLLSEAVQNKKAMRDASTIAMLKLKEDADQYEKTHHLKPLRNQGNRGN